jgi:hydroxymethylpyrimidine/phosphomethylpyrimidine kinase
VKRILVIAGSDSSGGAGIQADIKTAQAFGVYAQTAITAVTVQNTLGVTGAHIVPPDVVRAQIIACLSDIGADAIKTGMLGSAEMVTMVADTLAEHAAGIPLVVDPVMVAKGGSALLDPDAVAVLKKRLLPLAALLTPNLPEAEALTGILPTSNHRLRNAAMVFKMLGSQAVLFKGGHGESDVLCDTLWHGNDFVPFEAPRQKTQNTHGTGCTLATAIACGLAHGLGMVEATGRAHAYVQSAIRAAPNLGKGHGPLNHAP